MQVKKQQLEPNAEQLIDSKLGKAYVKAVYCHFYYLIYMQSTSRLYIVTFLFKLYAECVCVCVCVCVC